MRRRGFCDREFYIVMGSLNLILFAGVLPVLNGLKRIVAKHAARGEVMGLGQLVQALGLSIWPVLCAWVVVGLVLGVGWMAVAVCKDQCSK